MNDKQKNDVVIFIDMEKFEVESEEMSVRELLELAEEDPQETSLVLKHGNDLDKFDDLNQIVELKNGMKFIVYHNTPTPVSYICGQARLADDFKKLGFDSQSVSAGNGNKFVLIKDFEIPSGRFAGRRIELGIPAMDDYPASVGSSIHIKAAPQLLDYSDTVASVRNIVKSALGDEWRYWSHRFVWSKDRSARRLISLINGVFNNA